MNIKFPQMPVQFGGIDLMKFFEIAFTVMVEKDLLTENELVGYFAKFGFTVTPTQMESKTQENIHDQGHEEGCVCEACQRLRGVQ